MKTPLWLRRLLRDFLLALVRLLVGGKAVFDALPTSQCVIFANHGSHLDALLILAALPPVVRNRVRPVAGSDYWAATPVRRYIANEVLHAVLIDRNTGGAAALVPLQEALDEGHSLIVFPEGTRRAECTPGPFKSGLFYLSVDRPELDLVPVYLENLHRAMPKGAPFPLPLLCRVHVGQALRNASDEEKDAFLQRAHAAVCALSDF